MRTVSAIAVAAAMLVTASCGERNNEELGSGELAEAPAVPLVDGQGNMIGEVRGGDSDGGAVLMIQASGLPQGVHGMHIHDIGVCEGPGFQSAGPHWNPTNAQHGMENPQGPHMGDLQNVTVGADGQLNTRMTVANTYLRTAGRNVQPGTGQILDASGAALVIHATADDERTDPSGNSGDRIACAVLGAPEPGAIIGGAGVSQPPTSGGNTMDNAMGNATENGASAQENIAQNSITVNRATVGNDAAARD